MKNILSLETLEDLLNRDKQREKDGFPKKIKVGKIPGGTGKVTIVPTTEEEKLYHGKFEPHTSDGEAGQGEGEVGEVIGEQPIEGNAAEDEGEEGEGNKPGGDEAEEHGIEADIYKIGEQLTKECELPNLKDKGKKVPTTEYIYDLTDRHTGTGQLLDKKATLRMLVRTNSALGRIDRDNPDTTRMLVGPKDKVYRVLSREKVYKSQAIVFFVRDYSGSMIGDSTKVVVSQHLMIYSWLVYQYQKLVIPRFILHDAAAKEVPDFETYFKSSASGGTRVISAYQLVNKIVYEEGLERDYNIYVFHGTDGDDWDDEGEKTVEEIEKILLYVNRMGISVARNGWNAEEESAVEEYVKESGILENRALFRLFAMKASEATDSMNIKAIKELIS